MLQGNTYLMPIRIEDCEGNEIQASQVESGEFVFGEIVKFYGGDGEVYWSSVDRAFIFPLTEEETFSLKKAVKYQGRVLLTNGAVSGSKPQSEYVYESIGTTRLSNGESIGEQSGKILTMQLLDRVQVISGGGGIAEETDPTVPEFVKNITEGDIASWNAKLDKISATANNDRVYIVKSDGTQGTMVVTNGLDANAIVRRGNGGQFASPEPTNDLHVANKGYVDRKVADLVNSAPETLDTLGEVAQAIKDNEDVVDALNSAIGNKADKSSIPVIKATQLEDGSYSLTITEA